MEQFGTGLSVLIVIFLVVLAILWFILPFAIFGTKPRLDRIAELLEQQSRLLAELNASTRGTSDSDSKSTAPPARHIQFRE